MHCSDMFLCQCTIFRQHVLRSLKQTVSKQLLFYTWNHRVHDRGSRCSNSIICRQPESGVRHPSRYRSRFTTRHSHRYHDSFRTAGTLPELPRCKTVSTAGWCGESHWLAQLASRNVFRPSTTTSWHRTPDRTHGNTSKNCKGSSSL